LNTKISQGGVAMQLRCGVMFNNDFIANSKFTSESASERTLKIG